jgi:hypothetical protein
MTDQTITDAEKAFAPIRAYIDALNSGDVDGVRAAYHFPHVLFNRGRVVHYPTADSFSLSDFLNRVGPDGWVRSSIDSHRVVLSGPQKVHFDVRFTRWRADGSAIGVHHSLYIVTEIDGRWGLQSRSSYG